jgi:hypothetical protein
MPPHACNCPFYLFEGRGDIGGRECDPKKKKSYSRFVRPAHLLHCYSQYFGIPLRHNNNKQAGNGGENLGSISYFDSQKSLHTPTAPDPPIVFGNWIKPEKYPSPTQERREILCSAPSTFICVCACVRARARAYFLPLPFLSSAELKHLSERYQGKRNI